MSTSTTEYIFYQSRRTLPFVDRAEGIHLWDEDGKEYLDACSGAVIANIGYGRSRVSRAVAEQAQKTYFAYRLHFENEPAARLSELLVQNLAPHLNRVYFVSGGSEAVESAMKLARQYAYVRGEGGRHKFISRWPSYHGSTLGALSLTSYSPLEIPFRQLIKSNPKIPAPYCYRCPYRLTFPGCELRCAWALEETILQEGPENVLAFVVEPVGGASTGALTPPEGYFDVIQEICRKYGLLLILDEVMTGFGRTGKLFAYEHWDIEADIIALSKGMAAGYFPLGAAVCRADIVEAFQAQGGFFHGHTYCGNPMACAVGLEVLRIILEEDLPGNAARMGKVLGAGLEELSARHPIIGQVRGMGLLWALEFVRDRDTREPFPPGENVHYRLTDEAFEQGLIVYPRRPIMGLKGDHLLIAPPLIITEPEVAELLDRLDSTLSRVAADLFGG